jgi:integrase
VTGGPLPKANVTRRMRAALKAAKLDSSHRFHDLRHTFGTRMAAAGTPMRTLQEWMGHKDLATTQIYATTCRRCGRPRWWPRRSGMKETTR